MTFNYSKLKGRIIEKFGNQSEFAKAMNCSERTMSLKLNNKIPWRQTEICRALELLCVPIEEVSEYFFIPKVK